MTDSVDLTFFNDGNHFHFKLGGEIILSIDNTSIDYAKAEDIYICLLHVMLSVLR